MSVNNMTACSCTYLEGSRQFPKIMSHWNNGSKASKPTTI